MKGKKIKRKISVILLVVMMLFGSFGNSVFAAELNPADETEQNLLLTEQNSPDCPPSANITLKKRYEEKPSTLAIIKLDGAVWSPTSPTSDTYQADLIIDKEYEISEIAPAGFLGVANFKIKFVRHDGHVRLESVGGLPVGVKITSGDHLEIYNSLSEREFKFEKYFEKLNGEYPETFPDFTIAYPDGTSTVYSSTNGEYDDVLLKIGDNTFTESNVPAGYETIGSFVITMDRDGELSSSDLPDGVTFSNRWGKIEVYNSVIEREVQLVKTYEGEHETSAKFYVNGDRIHMHDGAYEKVEFRYGRNYTFSETNVPEGYEGVEDFVLTLDAEGNLASVGDLPEGVTIDGLTVSVFNKYITREINILKTDGEDELSGAAFTINGDEMRVSEGGDRFSADINNVITYTISETAPVGYIGTADFTIKLNSDRTALEVVGELPDGVTIDGLVITVANTKMTNTMTIVKTDGKDLLSGSMFKISDLAVNVDAAGSTFSTLIEHGIIYTVHESIVPAGYTGVADFLVTLSDDGESLVAVGELPSGVTIDGMTITVANTLIPVIPTDPNIPNTGDNTILPTMLLLFAVSGSAAMYIVKKRKDMTKL